MEIIRTAGGKPAGFRPLAGESVWKVRRTNRQYGADFGFRPLAGESVWKDNEDGPDALNWVFPSPRGGKCLERVHLWSLYCVKVSGTSIDAPLKIGK